MSTSIARQFYRDGRPVDGQPAPVATTTQWQALTSNQQPGQGFVIHRLDAQRWSLRHGAWALLLGAVPIAIGVLVCSRFWPLLFEPGKLVAGLFLEALGTFALWVGLSSIWKSFDTLELDRRSGSLYRSRRYRDASHPAQGEALARLTALCAVQLLAKFVTSTGKSRHTTVAHEINLVLADGRRINLIDGKSRDASMADAEALSAFLAVPLWQMTDL